MMQAAFEDWWQKLERRSLTGACFRYVRQHFARLFRFVVVGGSIAILNLFTFYLCREVLGLSDRMSVNGMYVTAVIVHFLSHRRVTFEAHAGAIGAQGGRYLVMLVWNYLLYQGLVGLAPVLHVSAYLAVLVSGALTVVSNFLLMNHYIFRRSTAHPASEAMTRESDPA